MYLYSNDHDLEQLQEQLVRLTALGVIFITRAHEEVFELPSKSLILLINPDPMAACHGGKPRVVMVAAMTIALRVMLAAAAAAVCGAVVNHGAGQAFSLCETKKHQSFIFSAILEQSTT